MYKVILWLNYRPKLNNNNRMKFINGNTDKKMNHVSIKREQCAYTESFAYCVLLCPARKKEKLRETMCRREVLQPIFSSHGSINVCLIGTRRMLISIAVSLSFHPNVLSIFLSGCSTIWFVTFYFHVHYTIFILIYS